MTYLLRMDDPFSAKNRFDAALGNRVAWWLTARTLRDAATMVHDGIPDAERQRYRGFDMSGFTPLNSSAGIQNVFVFLAGLALENLLKGEIVRMNPNAVSGGKLQQTIKSHYLIDLARSAGLVVGDGLTVDEVEILAIATEACFSWGRYPGGSAHDKPGSIAPPYTLDNQRFKQLFEALFDRLEASVMQGIDDTENGGRSTS